MLTESTATATASTPTTTNSPNSLTATGAAVPVVPSTSTTSAAIANMNGDGGDDDDDGDTAKAPTSCATASTAPDDEPTAEEASAQQLLAQFGRLAATEPESLTRWLREQASSDCVRLLHRVTGELCSHGVSPSQSQSQSQSKSHSQSLAAVAAATTSTTTTGATASTSRRTTSVTSELFQQWLSSSAVASPRMVSNHTKLSDRLILCSRQACLTLQTKRGFAKCQ